jgi:PAP2 superfamily
MKRIRLAMLLAIGLCAFLLVTGVPVRANTPDAVLEWDKIMNDTVLAGGTNPLFTTRVVALVSASVFDAVNGIDRRFQPLHVKPNAPHPASPSAAAIGAAYEMLVTLYPGQKAALDTSLQNSLAALASSEKASSINAGLAWGISVADSIFAWRSTDGFTPPSPPFVGVLGIEASPAATGVWRPTPLLNASGAGPQFATMTPWVLKRPSQFRLAPPLALNSPEYAADVEETKTGVFVDPRPAQLTRNQEVALFWAGNTALYWNRIASQLSGQRGLTLSENAHLFALLNVTMADAGIACWDGKYRYVFWRPITTIRAGVGTSADSGWRPWLDTLPPGTPAHPEYPSGHSTVSGAAAFILAAAFGENTSFSVGSEIEPGTTHQFSSFSDATDEIADARVFGGIHFRTSCVRGNALGRAVAEYVSTRAMRSGDDDRD